MNKRKSNDTYTKSFRGNPDYKSAFSSATTALITAVRSGQLADRTERARAIEALISEYVEAVGERPAPAELERLANAMLHEELTDQRRNKVQNEEHPILSETQYEERTAKEIPLYAIEERMGSDGNIYDKPTRRVKTKREKAFLDRMIKSRNRERKRAHENFKNGKDCGVFTVVIATGEKILRNAKKYAETYR